MAIKHAPQHFEDFVVGREYSTPEIFSPIPITDEMIRVFADVTGDHNPLHFDEDFCRRALFGRRVAHGALMFSLILGMVDEACLWHGTCLAFTGVERLQFLEPAYPGDMLCLRLTVLEKDDTYWSNSKKRREVSSNRGSVRFFAELLNQEGNKVLMSEIVLLFRKRGYFE